MLQTKRQIQVVWRQYGVLTPGQEICNRATTAGETAEWQHEENNQRQKRQRNDERLSHGYNYSRFAEDTTRLKALLVHVLPQGVVPTRDSTHLLPSCYHRQAISQSGWQVFFLPPPTEQRSVSFVLEWQ